MPDQVTRVVLLPRYTAVYGANPLYMAPFNVKRFAKVVLAGAKGRGLGTSMPDVTVTIEQSADLGLWHSAGSLALASSDGNSTSFNLKDLEWARVKVEVTPALGEPPGTTVWAVGAFVPREGM